MPAETVSAIKQRHLGSGGRAEDTAPVDRKLTPLSAPAPLSMGAHHERTLAVDGVGGFAADFVAAVQRNAVHPQLAINRFQDGWS